LESVESPMGTIFSPNNRGPSNIPNPLELLAGVASLVGAGILIWALVVAAELVFFSATALIVTMLGLAPDGVISNIILSSIAGVFAGIAVTMIRSLHRKPRSIEKSFVSALFSKGLAAPSLDGLFWTKVMLSTLVGLLVGALTGADGFISFPQAVTGTAEHVFSTHYPTQYPLIEFISGGLGGSGAGFGGAGGMGFWSALFLIIVIIVTAMIIGSLSGLFVHLTIRAIAGATKASTKELVLQSLEDPAAGESKGHPFGQGIIRGALTGVLVGLIEAVFTLWGISAFYQPPVH
jgi:hypothetical protein